MINNMGHDTVCMDSHKKNTLKGKKILIYTHSQMWGATEKDDGKKAGFL